MTSKVWPIILLILIIAGGFLFYKNKGQDSSNDQKVQIGDQIADLGREHVTDIYGIEYNSNPPTSGKHFPVWAKRGVYDRLLSDGYLIHSLEHGYIVISYDCTKISTTAFLVSEVSAHDEPLVLSPDSKEKLKHMNFEVVGSMSWFTPQNAPAAEVELPEEFKSNDCKNLVDSLKIHLDDNERVVIVPRFGMDTKIALTAWTRILKLDNIDDAKIKEFIDTYHNKGPEKTVE